MCDISNPKILTKIKFISRMNRQEWDENELEVDSLYHLPGDPYFPVPHTEWVLILTEDSETKEDHSEDPELME